MASSKSKKPFLLMGFFTAALFLPYAARADLRIGSKSVAQVISGVEKSKKTPPAARPKPASAASSASNDSWYTMQTGNTPWGYFHEVIETKDDKYAYRYEMIKKEGGVQTRENIGALASLDLVPITFNLSKSTPTATEIVEGTYSESPTSGAMKINVSGLRSSTYTRHMAKGTILEVFFPVWVHKNWAELVNVKGKYAPAKTVLVFTEDPTSHDFLPKPVRVRARGIDSSEKCLRLDLELDRVQSTWCLRENGMLISLQIPSQNVVVKRVQSEQAAKAFLGSE